MSGVCVLVPSIALSMLTEFEVGVEMFVRFIEFKDFIDELRSCSRVISYVRHKPTNDILLQHNVSLEVVAGEYKVDPKHLDKIYIVALKFRPPQGVDVQVKPNDLLIAKLTITWGA